MSSQSSQPPHVLYIVSMSAWHPSGHKFVAAQSPDAPTRPITTCPTPTQLGGTTESKQSITHPDAGCTVPEVRNENPPIFTVAFWVLRCTKTLPYSLLRSGRLVCQACTSRHRHTRSLRHDVVVDAHRRRVTAKAVLCSPFRRASKNQRGSTIALARSAHVSYVFKTRAPGRVLLVCVVKYRLEVQK
jgi:hypothetical protein